MDIITAKLGASMAKSELAKSGQIGYIGKKKQVVFPQTTLNFIDGGGYFRCDVDYLPLVNDEEYTAVFDGTEYKCIAYADTVGNARMGNRSIAEIGEVDTGEPFYYFHFEGLEAFFLATTPGNHTIEIYTEEEEVVTIDPKFLPEVGGGLPVVEFTTYLQTGATLTAEENAALDEAFASNMPIVISAGAQAGNDYLQLYIALNPMEMGSYRLFAANVNDYKITLKALSMNYSDHSWSVTLEKVESNGLLVLDTPAYIGERTTFTSNENAILTKAWNAGAPILIKAWYYDCDYNPFKSGNLFQPEILSDNGVCLKSCTNNIRLQRDGAGNWSCIEYAK